MWALHFRGACDGSREAKFVLTLDGWRESVGVAAEMKLARNMGKPIRYYDPERA